VTSYIYRNPDRFVLREVLDDVDRSGLRWTVDTPGDYAFASAVYRKLGWAFEFADVLALLDHEPELAELNRGSIQKEFGE
jgi:spore coat polysaccharide biosynthesis protein SpsF